MKQIHARIDILSEDEIQEIHGATLDVLWTVGCRLPHRRVLDRLAAWGAKVDYVTAQVKLPPRLVEDAMNALSKGRRITAEDRLRTPVPRVGRVSIFPSGQATIVDYKATSRRRGTAEDVVKGLVLCNELPYVRYAMPLVAPSDAPSFMSDLYGYYLCALYSRKPYHVYIMTPEAARQVMRIAQITAQGGVTNVRYLLEPNGALSYDDFSLEMALAFADAGYGFTLAPMAMAGLDAPVTLAGTLVMQNAYNLIGNVLAHLWGVPGCWSGSAHTMDLRSSLCSFGSPNQVLIALAAVQLGHWYGFETHANTGLTDACLPDFQAGFEKGMSAVVTLLAGGRFGAQGIVGADQGASLEQLVIDNEWASALDHIFSHGIEVNEDTLGVEAIRRVGILGNFLTDEHTLRHMRATYWHSAIFNHESWDAWMAHGGKDVYARAHEEVERILTAHYPPQPVVSETIHRQLQEIITDAAAHPERFESERYRYQPSATSGGHHVSH